MSDESKKPAAGIDLNLITPAAPVKRPSSFSGGLEPGVSLHGSRAIRGSNPAPTPEEEKAALLAEVKKMSGPEMRKWLKVPGNEAKLNEAKKL